jgi:mannose-6-phosphate isomerase-like protein (cupin superfamily)
MPAPKHAWVTSSKTESKPWGSSQFWHADSGFHGKVITIREGKRTSLKYHKIKDEFFFILSGRVRVMFGNSRTLENSDKHPWNEKVLGPGDVFNVQSECPYRFHALEESVIIEVGNRPADEPVRIEDDYGRKNE